jgi:hypothetical protein
LPFRFSISVENSSFFLILKLWKRIKKNDSEKKPETCRANFPIIAGMGMMLEEVFIKICFAL